MTIGPWVHIKGDTVVQNCVAGPFTRSYWTKLWVEVDAAQYLGDGNDERQSHPVGINASGYLVHAMVHIWLRGEW
jgi:hypothetical protein